MPDRHTFEVAAIGVGVTDTVNDRKLVVVEQLFDRSHRPMQSHFIVDLQQFVFRQGKLGTDLGVEFVFERNHRIDAVIATTQLKHYPNPLPGAITSVAERCSRANQREPDDCVER